MNIFGSIPDIDEEVTFPVYTSSNTGVWFCQTHEQHTWKKELLFMQYHYYCVHCGRRRKDGDKTYMTIRENTNVKSNT